ncbi:MAG: cytochrome c [Burkholderiales bacterium]|nr:cytochrome c [Burkholderiales bacterium]
MLDARSRRPSPAPHTGRAGCRLAAALAAAAVATAAHAADPPPAREAELVRLVRQDCGSCHGMTLRGGLGPPLTPQALADRPEAMLAATIIHGRPGTAMPPWRPFVTEAEADWIASRLKRGLGDDGR